MSTKTVSIRISPEYLAYMDEVLLEMGENPKTQAEIIKMAALGFLTQARPGFALTNPSPYHMSRVKSMTKSPQGGETPIQQAMKQMRETRE